MYLKIVYDRMIAFILKVHYWKYGSAKEERKNWSSSDPTLVSEGVFAVANVFSFARIIFLFQVSLLVGFFFRQIEALRSHFPCDVHADHRTQNVPYLNRSED